MRTTEVPVRRIPCEWPDYWTPAAKLTLDGVAKRAGQQWPAAFASLCRTVAGPGGLGYITSHVDGLLAAIGAREGRRCGDCRKSCAGARLALLLNPRARAALRACVLARLEGSVAP